MNTHRPYENLQEIIDWLGRWLKGLNSTNLNSNLHSVYAGYTSFKVKLILGIKIVSWHFLIERSSRQSEKF